MRIAKVEFVGHNLNLYISGCAGKQCQDCPTPEYQDFNYGDIFLDVIPEILTKIKLLETKKIYILGGEPFDSPCNDLYALCRVLKNNTDVDINISTHYDMDRILEMIKHQPKLNLLAYIDSILCLATNDLYMLMGGNLIYDFSGNNEARSRRTREIADIIRNTSDGRL